MRWPWQTREDPLIDLLDQVLKQTRESREEHSEILTRLDRLISKEEGDD